MRVTIIGAGISGLSLGYTLMEKKPDCDLFIFEAEGRPGGKIWTEKSEGYLCEASVNGFLNNRPETIQLAESLSLLPIRSNDNARKRYIYTENNLKLIPDSPRAFFTSDLLSLSGKLRVLWEYFVSKGKEEDESLESFALRRVGREFYEKLLDPMASGIYAGDPKKMSIRSSFPRVYEIEKKYGSLIKGFIAMSKEAKKKGKKVSAGPGGILCSFNGGMYSLVEALRDSLQGRIFNDKAVQSIIKRNNSYQIYFEDNSFHETDILILAIPAYEASKVLGDLDMRLSELINKIPYPPVTVVALGMKRENIKNNTDAFGFLIPAKEGRKILGALFDSSIFPERAPEGRVLLRTFVGGARAPELALQDDKELLQMVFSELKGILRIHSDPEFIRIFRWQRAIPQYLVGHHEMLHNLEEILKNYKGLYFTGNAYRGVSLNDCIANSFQLASRILSLNKE